MLLVAACSSAESTATDTSLTSTTLPVGAQPLLLSDEQCLEAARAAAAPMQQFIDQYGELSIEAWNALDPPPNFDLLQLAVRDAAQAAANRGCDATKLEEKIAAEVEGLRGSSEVGQAIAAALRGDGPPLGPGIPVPVTTLPRETDVSTVALKPGDDLAAILARVADGSTIELAAGIFEFDQTILIDVGVNLVGAGRDETVVRSAAEGVALAFVGPGGLGVRDMTIEHAGDAEASILLAIEGPVTVSGANIKGAVAGSGESGGGHGIVFAFDQLPGFPERTAEQRAGALLVEDSVITGNAAAGILITGDAAPQITGSTISANGGCGICYSGSSAGTVSASTLQANQIGIQVSDTSTPKLDDNTIVDSIGVGISIDGSSTAQIVGNTIDANGEIGIQIAGAAKPTIEHNTVSHHGVGILATDTSRPALLENNVNNHDVGIQVAGEAVVDAMNNNVWVTTVAAISYGDTSTGTIRGNGIVAAEVAGIQVTGSASPRVEGNVIAGAARWGSASWAAPQARLQITR